MAKWCVKAGKSKSAKKTCYKTKAKAKKAAKARRARGKKARVVKGC